MLTNTAFDRLHSGTAQIIYQYGIDLTTQLGASPAKIDNALVLASCACELPKERQRAAFKSAVDVIVTSPPAAFEGGRPLHQVLKNCAYHLARLDDEVIGQAATDLVVASDTHQRVTNELLGTIYELCISSQNSSSDEMRFARLPAPGRWDLFGLMATGLQRQAVPIEWCKRLLAHLPDEPNDMRAAAAELLTGIERG